MEKEEMFDVVDERDAVIGQASRSEVHAKIFLHRAVHVLVFDGAGRIFSQKRSLQKDSHPGKWCSSCSGHVDAGESYGSAAVRELAEEIGVSVSHCSLQKLFKLSAGTQTDWEFVEVSKLSHSGPFDLNPQEITDGEFFEMSALRDDMAKNPDSYTTSFKTIINILSDC